MNKTVMSIIVVLVIAGGGFMLSRSNQPSGDSMHGSSGAEIKDDKQELAQGAKIKISPERFDLGTVIYGEVSERIFTITNLGNQPLEILGISTSCGCTQAEVAEEDKVIAAGGSVPMKVSFDPAVHKDDADLGEITRIIYVKSNDAQEGEVEASISALVIREGEMVEEAESRVTTIQMTARQWEFVPNPIRVKEGDQVRLEITSPDVLHSFSLPDFGIDEELAPGKTSIIEFVADKKGTFDFGCAVYCGAGHGNMRGQLIVE